MKQLKHLGLHIETEILQKSQYIAKYHGRRGSGQIHYMLRMLIEDFEREHGEITKDDLKSVGIIK
ncbi:MAG: hypothetical protein E7635_06360 [Ruminococcaceae bacterium]|nr:hypothetical protein [Oscillospiraceae bacterium]